MEIFSLIIFSFLETKTKQIIFPVHMGQFLEMVGDSIPSFVGIKFTSTNLEEGAQAVRANSRQFAVFLGTNLVK